MSDIGGGFSPLELPIIPVLDEQAATIVRDTRLLVEKLAKSTEKIAQAEGRSAADVTKEQAKAARLRIRAATQQNKELTRQVQQGNRERILILQAYYRQLAQTDREGSQTRRREFERSTKQELADQKARNQRELAEHKTHLRGLLDEARTNILKRRAEIIGAVKEDFARQRDLARAAESDRRADRRQADATWAAELRRQQAEAVAKLKEHERRVTQAEKAAYNERLVGLKDTFRREDQARANAENDRRQDANASRRSAAVEERKTAALTVKEVARTNSERLQIQRAGDARELEQQRSASRSLYVSEQASEARRTARARAFYGTLGRITQSGFQATAGIVGSWLTRRERQASDSGSRLQRIEQRNASLVTRATALGIDTQTAEVSRGARRRLAAIEASAATERKVITANAVKTAEAQAAVTRATSTGVIGAATGRSNLAGGLLAGLGGGLAGRKILTTVSDFQSIETAFKGIFEEVEGAAPRTEAFLKEMQEFAKQTPYGMRDLSTYAQKFFSSGLVDPDAPGAIDDLKNKLLALSDAASATGKTQTQIEGGLLGITQIAASGRASLEDLRQIAEGTGVSFKLIAGNLGLSVAELFDQLEKGEVSAEAALSAVFQGLQQIPGAAGASARQAKNLRGAWSSLMDVVDQGIIKVFKPLGEQLALLISGLAGFLGKVLDGKGAFEIIRKGLVGIAVGLGAIIAAKGAVQVINLLGAGLKILAANPLILGIAALGAAVAVLPKVAPGVASFFTSLYEGSKLVGKAGYDLGRPIEGLSKLVLLQSSVGAAARTITDGLRRIYDVFILWRAGLADFGDVTDVIGQTLGRLGDNLGRSKDVLVDVFRDTLDRAESYLSERFNSGPIASVRSNIGSYLLALLGLTGGGGGIVSRLLTTAISKLFIGSIKDFDSEAPAAQMGERTREIINNALQSVSDFRFDVAAFFVALFSGAATSDAETAAASSLGAALNNIVTSAFAAIGERVGPVADFLSNIGKAITNGFTTFVLPALLTLPFLVGRFLSRTVFSEEFLKAFSITAAGLAAAAIGVAGTFIAGFLVGLYERRGDILKTFQDIFGFVVKGLGGSGSPIVLLGGLLVAAFVGSKVKAAIDAMRGRFGVAMLAMGGDVKKVQEAQNRLNYGASGSKVAGPGAKSANAALAVGEAWRKTGTFIVDTGRKTEALGVKTQLAANKIQDIAPVFSQSMRVVGMKLEALPRQAQGAFRLARSYAGAFVETVKSTIPEGFSKAEGAVRVGVGAITGYMTGMAATGQAKAIGFVASISEIASAYAVGGPIFAGITGAVTAISYFWGESSREAKEQAEVQRKIAENQAALVDTVTKSYVSAFRDLDGTGAPERGIATLTVFRDLIDSMPAAAGRFVKKLGGSYAAVSRFASEGQKPLEAYLKGLTSDVVAKAMSGNEQAVQNFRKEYVASVDEIVKASGGLEVTSAQVGSVSDYGDRLAKVNGLLKDNRIDIEGYAAALTLMGVPQEQVNALVKDFKDSLSERIDTSGVGQFSEAIRVGMRNAIAEQEAYAEAASQVDRAIENSKSVADRFSGAFERVKTNLDKARNSYTDWIDATTGKQRTVDEQTQSIFSRAQEFFPEAQTDENGNPTVIPKELREANERIVLGDAERDLGGVVAQFAKESKSVEELQGKINSYFETLRNSPGVDQKTIDFLNLLQATVKPDALALALNQANPPIKSLEEFKTKFQALLQDPVIGKGIRVRLSEADDYDDRKRIIEENLEALANYDPTVKTYLEDHGVEETLKLLNDDYSIFDGEEINKQINLNIAVKTRLEGITASILDRFGFGGVVPERWGGTIGFARGGITQAHVARGQRIRYAEPETGGEAFIPRKGNRARSEKIASVVAGWLGGAFIPKSGKTIGFAKGGIYRGGAGGGAYGRDGHRWDFRSDGYWYDMTTGKRLTSRPNREDSPINLRSDVPAPTWLAAYNAERVRDVVDSDATSSEMRERGITEAMARAAGVAEKFINRIFGKADEKVDGKPDRTAANWSGNDGDITFRGGLSLSNEIVRNLLDADKRQQLTYSGRPGSTKPSYKTPGMMAGSQSGGSYEAAVAKVMAADAAKKASLDPAAYLQWAMAVGNLFNGGKTNPFATLPVAKEVPGLRQNKGLLLDKGTRPPSLAPSTGNLPTNSVTFGQNSGESGQSVSIKREVNLTQNIYDVSGNPTMTALEVSRRAADADFMAGGDLWEVPKR